jgi:hypothetical protein
MRTRDTKAPAEKRATVTDKISHEGTQETEEAHRRSSIKEIAEDMIPLKMILS